MSITVHGSQIQRCTRLRSSRSFQWSQKAHSWEGNVPCTVYPWDKQLFIAAGEVGIEFRRRPHLHGLGCPVMESFLQLSLQFEGLCLHLELVDNCYNPNAPLVFSQKVQLRNSEDSQLAVCSLLLRKSPSSPVAFVPCPLCELLNFPFTMESLPPLGPQV